MILSMLWVKRFQIIWFCMLELVRGQPALTVLFSGICRIFRNNNKQLFMLSHWSRSNSESFSMIRFMWSTTALVLRPSVNASLLVVKSRFNSKTVCLPTSVRDMASTGSKYSTGIVKLPNILMVASMIFDAFAIFVLSFTCNKIGTRCFLMFCPNPMALRNVRRVQSSMANLLRISSNISVWERRHHLNASNEREE